MKVRILGKNWNLQFVPRLGKNEAGEDKAGDCDHPEAKNKSIRVLSGLRGEKRLDTIIHEFLHAADWTKDEEWVAASAHDLARILTRLGYKEDE